MKTASKAHAADPSSAANARRGLFRTGFTTNAFSSTQAHLPLHLPLECQTRHTTWRTNMNHPAAVRKRKGHTPSLLLTAAQHSAKLSDATHLGRIPRAPRWSTTVLLEASQPSPDAAKRMGINTRPYQQLWTLRGYELRPCRDMHCNGTLANAKRSGGSGPPPPQRTTGGRG